MSKNVKLIKKNLIKINSIILISFCVISIVINQPKLGLSAIIGSLFSYIIFSNLISTQEAILSRRNKNIFFIKFIFRLALYAIPIVITLQFRNYINFATIVIFLFSYQISLIIFEVKKNLKSIKRKKD